jgi:hypothetical protein
MNVKIIKPEPVKPEFVVGVGEYFFASWNGKGKMRLRQLIETGKNEYAIFTPETAWIRGQGTLEYALNFYSHKQKVKVVREAEITVEPVGDVVC